jgi:hypothetical protein
MLNTPDIPPLSLTVEEEFEEEGSARYSDQSEPGRVT